MPKAKEFTLTDNHSAGFRTKAERSQLPDGAMSAGSQNVVISDGDLITVAKGSELFGASSSATTPIKSSYTHRRRDGVEVPIRTYSTVIEFYHAGTGAYETLQTGFTSGLEFGFADFDRSDDSTAHVRFGNKTDQDRSWNGQYTQLNGALSGSEATITVDDTTGFDSSGSLIIGTTTVTYTGKSSTTFTGCTGTPSASDDASVAQLPTSLASSPKGNIYLTFQNRLLIANVNGAESSVYCSAVDDDTDFTFSSPRVDGEGFIANISKGGDRIRALTSQQERVWIGKLCGWGTLEFIQFSDNYTDFPIFREVIMDDKNPFLGPVNNKAVSKATESIFFMAKNGGVKQANKINAQGTDYFELSDPIRKTLNTAYVEDSATIVHNNKLIVTYGESSDDTFNNTMISFNMSKNAWEAPRKGRPVSSFFIYNGYAYGGSSTNPESFKFLFQDSERTSDTDGDIIYPVQAIYKTGDLNFGERVKRKSFSLLYVEGFITPSTTLNVRVLYEYNGIKGVREGSIAGTDTNYLLTGESSAEIGLQELGIKELSFEEGVDKPKFRVLFSTSEQPFNEISLEFKSDGKDQDWSILAWGPNVKELEKVPINNKKALT